MITLLTDFGLRDHYVAAMKGVILSICPGVQLVDISHNISAYQVLEAAYTLSQAWHYFAPGTIHLAVVDPGVGSSRRPILVEARGHFFVAPDNGLLTLALHAISDYRVWHITETRYFRDSVSQTFHGRDVFAPVAAYVASGVLPEAFGTQVRDIHLLQSAIPLEKSPGKWTGAILQVDIFGNIITNFDWSLFKWVAEEAFILRVGTTIITRFYPNYSASTPDELFVLGGSSGFLEVSLNQADATARLGVAAGAEIEIIRPSSSR